MKAFATAFLGDQAKAIQKRIQDAEDYEDEQREKAERNKATIGKRRSLVNLAKTEINLLKKMGAKDKHINAAIAAGPKALFEFSQALQKEAQKRPSAGGSYTFSESELDAFIEMPEEFTTETMDPAEHYARSIGLAAPSLGSYEAKEQGFVKSALGMGLKDSVRSRLDKDAYYEGYSMMDINEVARQEAYESMAPGTYFSFKPSVEYNPVTVGPAFRDAYADASEVSAAVDAELRDTYPSNYTEKKKELIERQQAGVIDAYAQQFGRRFLEDISINLQGLLGNELYTATYARHASLEDLERYIVDNLIGMKDIDVGSTIKVVDGNGKTVEITLGENNEVSSMTIDNRAVADDEVATLVASLQGAGLLSEASIKAAGTPLPEPVVDPSEELAAELEENVSYSKNRKVVEGVPPRPNSFTSRFTGLSLDYETREKIRRGEITIPEQGLRVDEWDELFGDTHNPDGSRKAPTNEYQNRDRDQVAMDRLYDEDPDMTPLEFNTYLRKLRKDNPEVTVAEAVDKHLESKKPQETVDKSVEPDILDLRNYETEEEKDEAFDALPIGGLFYDDDGSGPFPKGKERNG
jgi:hypothetical protein